jgi:hypothetical protein
MINWGRNGWKFLHAITFAYPTNPTPKTKRRYMNFFKSIKYVLPCKVCRDGYAKNVKSLSLRHMQNQYTLSRWLVGVHNQVNFKLGKRLVGYNSVMKEYK